MISPLILFKLILLIHSWRRIPLQIKRAVVVVVVVVVES